MASTSYVPMMNPTGVTGSGFGNIPGLGTGGPGNFGFGNTMNPNPSTVNPRPFVTPTGGPVMNPGGGGITPGSGGQWSVLGEGGVTTPTNNPWGLDQSQLNWAQKYLQETYGGGMGAMIMQYLNSNGGFNSALTQQAVNSQVNAMQQQNMQGANDIESRLGAMGVSGSSSSMPLALSQYETGVSAQENAITAQEYYNMWQQSQQNELNMMQFAAEGTGKTLANKPNWMDYASMGLGFIGDAVGIGTGIKSLANG